MSAQFLVSLITIVIVANIILLSCAYLILLERKISAWAQDRIGPNRVGFSFGILPFKGRHFGLGQALADGIKLFIKEDYTPPHVDKSLFILAPALAVITAIVGWAVIPWGGTWAFPGIAMWGIKPQVISVTAAPINIGVIYILAISSLAVYGVAVGAYASNNKYAFLGGLRAVAQMLSYEIPMGLIVLIMIMVYRTTDAGVMANLQAGSGGAGVWGIFLQPLLAVIFFTASLAETNRAPFDLAEAEQELVGGFHTEYSSMKWALFFLGEYMHMITGSAFFCVLFLGGWDLIPFVHVLPIIGGLGIVVAKFVVFAFKVFIMLSIMMWVRWTLPRFRFDQLMKMAWRGLIPICLVMLLVTGLCVWLRLPIWTYTIANIVVAIAAALIGPRLPQGPAVNRKVRLAGSRFYPPLPGEPG